VLEKSLVCFNFGRVKVEKNLDSSIPKVPGVREELRQVFVNLIQNSLEAMPAGGTLTVRTYLEDERPAVEIADTGRGIKKDIQEKIFDPFFSTRHVGVGLGLSIVYRIVREHGGDIRLTSKEGQGASFKIIF
jgi:two-component system, sporulation sensor kinase E